MTDYEITSYVGVGDLKFGMKRADVHQLLGSPDSSETDNDSNESTDYWQDDSLQLNFSEDGDLIEISLYANLKNVKFKGMNLFEEPGIDVMKSLKALDNTFIEEVGIYTFPGLGLAVTGFLDADEYKSVTAFKAGLEDL